MKENARHTSVRGMYLFRMRKHFLSQENFTTKTKTIAMIQKTLAWLTKHSIKCRSMDNLQSCSVYISTCDFEW